MNTPSKNQSGFSSIEVILVIVIVAAVSSIGWFVWHSKQTADKTLTPPASATPTFKKKVAVSQSAAVQIPSGWVWYSGDGFKFAYPDVYTPFATLTVDQSSNQGGVLSMWQSSIPGSAPFAGVSGRFVLTEFKTTSSPVGTTKYGPTVKLEGGKWIITEVNPASSQYQVGAEYTEFVKATSNGIDTYTSKSGDEGGLSYHIIFVASGHLYNLSLPEFDTGTYGPTPSPNDQKPYDQLSTQLVGTISSTTSH